MPEERHQNTTVNHGYYEKETRTAAKCLDATIRKTADGRISVSLMPDGRATTVPTWRDAYYFLLGTKEAILASIPESTVKTVSEYMATYETPKNPR